MTRLRDLYQIKEVRVGDIQPEMVPLPYEINLKNALYEGTERQNQVEEIRLVELPNGPYLYRYKNGRRRGETIRAEEGDEGKVRAVIEPFNGEEELHLHALTSNSGKPNYPDESLHCVYLRDECGYEIKDIAHKTGLDYQIVRQRLLVYDSLIDKLFSMFQRGQFNFSSAWLITNKLDTKKQIELSNLIESGEIKTSKAISNFCKESETEDINKLFNTFDQSQPGEIESDKGQAFVIGAIITPEQIAKLKSGSSVVVNYNNEDIEICRCEW